MQTLFKRFSVFACFAFVLAILIANAWVTARQLQVLVNDQASVNRSRQVLYELSQTESLLKDAETGQRGYLYTGDAKYLSPYTKAISEVGPHIDRLAQLTAQNSRERALTAELRAVSKSKLDELARTISLYQSEKRDKARELVMTDLGLTRMGEIRDIVNKMEEAETSIEVARTKEYDRNVRGTFASIYLASFVAILSLVLIAYFILHEMQMREKHSAEMRVREEWFRTTLTSIGDAVIATDDKGRVTFLNPVGEKLTGIPLSQAMGKEIGDVFPIFNEVTRKAVDDPVKKVLQLGSIVGLANHTVLQRSDGSLIPIEDSAAPIRDEQKRLLGVVLVFRDVTHERKSQDVLRKTEKLAAASRLSATVAHEINNPLEAVVNLLFLAKNSPETPSGIAQMLTLAEQELERVAHLTRQTLGFYRESNQPEKIVVSDLIESVLRLYSSRLKNKNISVERQFDGCPPIYGISGELKQVLANLISNAADAVSQNGKIAVRLNCTEELSRMMAQIAVEDNGPGIARENADRIFEPFFTTKEDVGTGLGLWITKEIVERHGGSITAESLDGERRGAVFTILLPVNADLPVAATLAGERN
jgi:PAS domain S-box-containing protein